MADNRVQISFENIKSLLQINHHSSGAIKKPEDLEAELPDFTITDDEILDRIHGSMVGMALGDAVGARVEFRPQTYMEKNPVTDMKGGGTWGLKRGQFTDDTSMALCLANSLIVCQDFIPYDQLVRYKWWYRSGYMSSTGECFDIGEATRNSLEEFEHRQKSFGQKHGIEPDELDYLVDPEFLKIFKTECSGSGVAGNGALMRLTPVPLFFYRHPEYAVEFSGISGRITHGDLSAYDACRYYGALIVAALRGEKKDELLASDFYVKHKDWFSNKPLHPKIMAIAEGSFRKEGGHSAGIRGKGYIVQSLEAALWAFCYDDDPSSTGGDDNAFRTGVLAAVNLGDDTDTTAAIYGQLAGAYYGYQKLPSEWREAVYAKKFIHHLSKWIVDLGGKWRPETSLASDTVSFTSQKQSSSATDESNKQKAKVKTQPTYPQTSSQTKSKQSPEEYSKAKSTPKGVSKTTTGLAQDARSKPNNSVSQTKNHKAATPSQHNSSITVDPEQESIPGNPVPTHLHSNQSQDSATSASSSSLPNGPKTYHDVSQWVRSLGKVYEPYADTFIKHKVDGNKLYKVDNNSLRTYGVNNAKHRKDFLEFIQKLKEQYP